MARISKKQRKRQRAAQLAEDQANQAPSSPAKSPNAVSADSSQAPVKPSRRIRQPIKEQDSLIDELPPLIVGIACAILPTLVTPKVRDLYQLPKLLFMTDAATWLLLAIGVMALMGRKLRLPRTPLTWPLVGLIAAFGIGVGVAPKETGGVLSIFAKMDAYRWGAAVILGVGLMSTVRKPRHLLYVVGGMLIGGAQVALFGIAQHHNIRGLLPAEARYWVGINKPGSTFGNRNMAAQLIVSVMPAAYILIAMSLRWWSRKKSELAIAAGVVGSLLLWLLLYYLRLSVTRSAWGGAFLGLIVAGGIWFVAGRFAASKNKNSEQRRSTLSIGLAMLATGALVLILSSNALIDRGFKAQYDQGKGDEKRRQSITELVSTVTDFDQPHWSMRVMMWKSTWAAIKGNPIGGGAGNWRVLFPQYVTQRQANDHFSIGKQPTRAHNDFLQIWSEFGTQGFVSFLALLAALVWMSWRTAAIQRSDIGVEDEGIAWMAYASVTSLAGIVAICGDALLSFPFQLPAPTFLFFIHLGVIGAAYVYATELTSPVEADKAPVFAPAAKPSSAMVATLVACAIGAALFTRYENSRLRIAEVGFSKARSNNRKGNQSSALKAIQQAIEINPDDFQNHFIEALCYNKLGDANKSVASIQRSLNLYPNLLNAWVNLSMFARKAGKKEVMNHALDMALQLKPDEAYALNIRARQWLQARKFKETAALLKPFIEVHSSNIGFLRNAEKAFRALKDYPTLGRIQTHQVQAIKALRLSTRMRNYTQRRQRDARRVQKARLKGWEKVGDTWVRAKDWKRAEGAFAQAAALAKQSRADLKRKYALALANNGKWSQATHECGVTLALDKKQADALLTGLESLRKSTTKASEQTKIDRLMRGIEKGAAEVVKQRIARANRDDDEQITALVKKYHKQRDGGQPREAIKWLYKAAQQGKERRGDVKRAYSVALSEFGQWKLALHEAKVAIRIDWRQRDRLIWGLEKLRSTIDSKYQKGLEEQIAKVRLL
ncbi:MAG: hypothetical protein CMH53_08375 [Myxococcales bacterium]|nr:hypothetical protein [Myxococcales bacterium]